METKRIISFSGGLGSFASAWLTVQQHGKQNCELVFTDTKTEDEDLYRFLDETSRALELPLTRLADGRNIWEVFSDVRFMGNSRIDPCSRLLKRELFKKWMHAKHAPESALMIVGIGADESSRLKAIEAHWAPFRVEAPLCTTPMTREQILDVLDSFQIEPPRLYEMGFPHNNCGGFCVKTGQKQMKLLLERFPERYAWHEREQEKLFALIGKRRGFIRRTVDGTMHYMGLREFREMIERGELPDLFEEKGCGCFV